MNNAREKTLRIIGVTGLAAGPASLIATTVIQWMLQSSDPSATVFDAVRQNQGLWQIAGFLAVFGPLLWICGMPSAIGLARSRGWVMTLIGGVLTALGLAVAIGHLALYFGVFGDIALSGVSTEAAKAMARADDASALTTFLLLSFLVTFSLGPIVLTLGLRRAKVVPVWVPVAAIVMTVANFAGGPIAGTVQLVALVLTFVPIIVAVIRRWSNSPIPAADDYSALRVADAG